MTSKQCNTCKYLHIWKNNKHEDSCFYQRPEFMKRKNCPLYTQGTFEEIRKQYRISIGCELP